MIKNKTQLETSIGDKTFVFLCDPECTLANVKSALYQFLGYVNQIEDTAKKEKAEAEENEKNKPEEQKIE
jgi:hypothetical protein